MRAGSAIEVYCDRGRPGRFRAVAHCSNGLGFHWESHGSVGRVRDSSSYAECNSLLGSPYVTGYHIYWL